MEKNRCNGNTWNPVPWELVSFDPVLDDLSVVGRVLLEEAAFLLGSVEFWFPILLGAVYSDLLSVALDALVVLLSIAEDWLPILLTLWGWFVSTLTRVKAYIGPKRWKRSQDNNPVCLNKDTSQPPISITVLNYRSEPLPQHNWAYPTQMLSMRMIRCWKL